MKIYSGKVSKLEYLMNIILMEFWNKSLLVQDEGTAEETTAVSAVSSEEVPKKTVETEQASKAWKYNSKYRIT